MLKNGTLKNGTSRIGLYGSAPPPGGQCYDSASSMSRPRSGVAKKISDLESRAVYTHCYGHSLNLACMDTMKSSKVMQEALDITEEITKLVKLSPRRGSVFQRLKDEITPQDAGIRVLCPTRWTVKAEALKSIVDNFEVLPRKFRIHQEE